MDITVQTGHTKSVSGLFLAAHAMKSSQDEHVAVLLQIHASAQDAKTFEKECLNIVQHSLLETEGGGGERLDGLLKEMNGLMKGLLVSKSLEDVHAIIAIVDKDDVLHVSHAGRAEAYIVRGGAASQITEYTRGKSAPAFVHIASGTLEPRDVLVFSTQRLLRTLTPAQLAQLSQRGDQLLDEVKVALEAEKEKAALAVGRIESAVDRVVQKAAPRASGRRKSAGRKRTTVSVSNPLPSLMGGLKNALQGIASVDVLERTKTVSKKVAKDLKAKDPKQKKKAHLFLLAGAVAIFLVIWVVTNLATSTQHSQTRGELRALVEEIDAEIQNAENRHLTGDVDAANAILQRAQERAKQVMDNESGLYRTEALDLLDRIRLKSEEINSIVRLSPRVVVNLAAKSPNVAAQGFIGLQDGELIVFDRQDLYRVLLNSVDEPDRLSEEELIVSGTFFERMQTVLFQMTDNSITEIISGQPTSMKTEDPAGWIAGKALITYLRFLYMLSPENNQIYKYERLSNRFSAPAEYNINGELAGGLDIAIDGNVFVLKEGGEIVKLFRGETRPFTIRHLPDGALANATKIFKVFDGYFYILDPVNARVIVATDGGATGESSYVRQYILEGDQIGELKDLYIDPEELRLHVLDEKRVYAIDLATR